MTSFKDQTRQHNWSTFAKKHEAMAEYLTSHDSRFNRSVVCSIETFGSLTTLQEQAIKKMMK